MSESRTYWAEPCNITRLDPPRLFKTDERQLVDYLLQNEFAQKDLLMSNVSEARVIEEHDNCPTIVFRIMTNQVLVAPSRSVLLEGEGTDRDGMKYKMLFLSLGDLSYEIEFFRGDLGPFLSQPEPSQLHIETRSL